jgi:hypothetical protein
LASGATANPANLSLMNTRWHLRQLRAAGNPEFEARRQRALATRPAEPQLHLGDTARAATGTTAPPRRPEGSVFGLTEGQLDSLPEAIGVRQNSGVQLDSLIIAFGNDYLTLQDIASIGLIRDNLGKRPIYFSWSDGNYPDQTLGLSAYLLTTGLVRKLMPAPIKEGSGIVFYNSLGFVDVPTTRKLPWGPTGGKPRPRPRAAGGCAVGVDPAGLPDHLRAGQILGSQGPGRRRARGLGKMAADGQYRTR